jgi:Alpha-acetolactate decarboxylase
MRDRSMQARISPLVAIAVLAIGPAAAQTTMPAQNSGLRTERQPYNIHSFGAFRMMILQGDFSPKVRLGEVMAEHPTTGVGAVADARGEITIYDGNLIVSYGKAGSQPAPDAERAALLAVGTTTAWQTVTVEHDIAPDDIDAFLAQTAAAHGLNPEDPFPFQVRGTLASYVMHVNAAPTNGPHGMGQPIAVTVVSQGDVIAGMVAGLYVSRDLIGIVTHGGTRTHSHWVASDSTATAHLDRWGLKSGAVLMLPKP